MPYTYDWENLSGSFHDIGVQHGSSNADRMRHLLAGFTPDLTAPWKESDFLTPLEKHLPDLAHEIHGIAQGSGLSLREVVALSFLVDLGYAGSSCTGVIFASGPDGPVVGKTSDCTPGIQQEWLRPRKIKPNKGFSIISHSQVGTPNTEMGFNDQGLAIGISGLLSLGYNPAGVGWQQDIRAILHTCSTTAQAIDMLQRIPIRKAGYALVVGDATGDVAVVEKLVGAVAVRRPQNNVIYEANVALTPQVLPHINPRWDSPNGHRRTAQLKKLTQDNPWPDFSLQGMINLFSQHDPGAGLCQHGPELHSQTGFFMLPQSRTLYLARGHTCQRNLEKATFDF